MSAGTALYGRDVAVNGVADVVPLLQQKGLFRERYEARSLRGLLGLPTTVPNRYAAV